MFTVAKIGLIPHLGLIKKDPFFVNFDTKACAGSWVFHFFLLYLRSQKRNLWPNLTSIT